MEAEIKKYKLVSGQFVETTDNDFVGYEFYNGGNSYRSIITSFNVFWGEKFEYILSLYQYNSISLTWIYVKNDPITADKNTYRDSANEIFVDSGNNSDSNNAYTYIDDVKTLKIGLISEYDLFYNQFFLAYFVPEISASIINKGLYQVTSIV